MNVRYFFAVALSLAVSKGAIASHEYLVKLNPEAAQIFSEALGGRLEVVSQKGSLYKWTTDAELARPNKMGLFQTSGWRGMNIGVARALNRAIDYIQPNFKIQLTPSPSLLKHKDEILAKIGNKPMAFGTMAADNPAVKAPKTAKTGADPLLKKAWGMPLSGAEDAWKKLNQGKDIVVAVTDTGVDYNHEDLIDNMWRNSGEIPGDGKDNDNNGYVDDVVGYDFAANDSLPYDLTTDTITMMFTGGNPGHGTHVAGVVGAALNNGLGTAGVAPKSKIMALRFITERGQGETASAIKAIDYAVDNGAQIINASWGGEAGDEDDTALIEAIERAMAKGVIFVAAAGNGRSNPDGSHGGYDNDNDAKPAVPASYDIDNIIAVAAIDSSENLASFSNWGAKSVKIGAPGVRILSTVPGDRYQETILDGDPFGAILGMLVGEITWDGTSMASPFVAGALAAVWSTDPAQSWEKVRDTLLDNTKAISALKGKVATNGRLEMRGL
jgi:thermitase